MTDRHHPDGRSDERAVPNLVLERYRLGELPLGERDAIAGRLEAEPEVREQLAALERSDGELRRRLEAEGLAARVRTRVAMGREDTHVRSARFWRQGWPLPAGLAVAATVVLAVALRTTAPEPRLEAPSGAPPTPSTAAPATSPQTTPSLPPPAPTALPASSGDPLPASPGDSGDGGVRLKGLRPALSLFRKTEHGSETLADGDVARDGDVIRIGYRAVGRRYGVIVSLDGRGGVTRHLPERGATAAALEASEVALLAHAYALDDAPAWERFFFVTADAPFEVATVEQAAHLAAGDPGSAAGQAPPGLPLPQALEQSTFLLMKERRP